MAHPLERDLNHVVAQTVNIWRALRGERIFITGGTGFVGTWLVESLAWANDHMGLDAELVVLTRNPEAFRAKAPYSGNHRSVQLVPGSLANFEVPDNEFSFVVHAATDQVQPSASEPAGTFDREVSGTRRVLDLARRWGTKRLLFTSSGAVYGRQPPQLTHIAEEYVGAPCTTDPGSAYGEAKRASEFLCALYARQFGFASVIARLFAFSGPYLPLDSKFAIGNFIRDVLAGGPVRIAGDGTPQRSYLYAADMAIWLWHLLVRGESAKPYNVGSPDAISIQQLAELIVNTIAPGTPIQILGKPQTRVPPARYVPSVERAHTELGLSVIIPLDEQIRRMYEWNRVTKPSSP